jgi:hypothetical protein
MPSSYQVVLWKQERFVVLRPLQIEFFRNLLEVFSRLPQVLRRPRILEWASDHLNKERAPHPERPIVPADDLHHVRRKGLPRGCDQVIGSLA